MRSRAAHPEARHRKRCLGLREELVLTLRRMAAGGLVLGAAGNVSARAGDLVVISPSALPYDTLRADDVCLVTAAGELVEGPKPSVELPMHLAVLAEREDVGAVVHTLAVRDRFIACRRFGPGGGGRAVRDDRARRGGAGCRA
jgi:ribulose-5-phosphate 4-epimerase/fuculose-1-phosphate aldolase